MADNKLNMPGSSKSGSSKIVVGLIALVLVAVGAIAFMSGKLDEKAPAEAPAAQTASSEPASGQDNPAEQPTQTAAVGDEQAPEIKPGNPVVAKVNGKEISRIDVFGFIQGLNEQTRQMPLEDLFSLARDQLINTEIVNEKLASVNLDSDPEVKKQLDLAKQQIVRNVFIEKEVEKATTDERLQQSYEGYVAGFPEIEEIKSRHILVKEEDVAKDLLKQIKSGADFAALAQEYSIDATKEKGGELGYIAKQDQVIPEYVDAIFGMNVGDVSKEPLKSEFGFHIIEVMDKRMREPAPYEQAKPLLAAQLRNQILAELIQKWRSNANVTVLDINGEPIEPAAGEESAQAQSEAPAAEAAPAPEQSAE